MTNIEKYQNAFIESFNLKIEEVANASVQTVDTWDSIGQMSLIAVMEDSFGIEFQADDVIGFDSYEKGIQLLKKYNINL